MSADPAFLAAAIRERHGTAHAFCRAHPELGRTTVYQLLRGRYPGNVNKQAGRVLAALAGQADEAERLAALLLRVACKRCGKRKTRRKCAACRDLCRCQAMAIMEEL